MKRRQLLGGSGRNAKVSSEACCSNNNSNNYYFEEARGGKSQQTTALTLGRQSVMRCQRRLQHTHTHTHTRTRQGCNPLIPLKTGWGEEVAGGPGRVWKRYGSTRAVLPGRVGRGAGGEGEEPGLTAGRQRKRLPPASPGLV